MVFRCLLIFFSDVSDLNFFRFVMYSLGGAIELSSVFAIILHNPLKFVEFGRVSPVIFRNVVEFGSNVLPTKTDCSARRRLPDAIVVSFETGLRSSNETQQIT